MEERKSTYAPIEEEKIHAQSVFCWFKRECTVVLLVCMQEKCNPSCVCVVRSRITQRLVELAWRDTKGEQRWGKEKEQKKIRCRCSNNNDRWKFFSFFFASHLSATRTKAMPTLNSVQRSIKHTKKHRKGSRKITKLSYVRGRYPHLQ